MKIDYIVYPAENTKKLVLIPELESENFQLKDLCSCMNMEWNFKFLEIQIK